MTVTPKPFVVVGPTASGKTGLAIRIAQYVHGEVISADSRQIYRGLNIGTEKVTRTEMEGVRHHCIDIASPRRSCSVEQWRSHALKAMAGCSRRGTTPIIAGGTGLYIDTLLFGTEFPAVKPNTALRRSLERKTPAELLTILTTLDPERAATIEPQNPRRLLRAIEIASALGRVPPLSVRTPRFQATWVGINPPFTVLEARIATRLDQALQRGLIEETCTLRDTLHLSWKRIDELGLEYRLCAAYLRGELAERLLRDTLVRDVRRYAKRQLTWLKRYENVQWFTDAASALTHLQSSGQLRSHETRSQPL